MLEPPFRWIGDISHHGTFAMHLHLHRSQQLCHTSCMVVMVIMVVVLFFVVVVVVFFVIVEIVVEVE